MISPRESPPALIAKPQALSYRPESPLLASKVRLGCPSARGAQSLRVRPPCSECAIRTNSATQLGLCSRGDNTAGSGGTPLARCRRRDLFASPAPSVTMKCNFFAFFDPLLPHGALPGRPSLRAGPLRPEPPELIPKHRRPRLRFCVWDGVRPIFTQSSGKTRPFTSHTSGPIHQVSSARRKWKVELREVASHSI